MATINQFIAILLFLPAVTLAQQTTKDKEVSNAEQFSQKSGTLIQREYEDIGTLKGCKIQVATFTDLINGQKQSALRFEYVASTSLGGSTKVSVLDADEVDGLIKAIRLLQSKIIPTAPANYTEAVYRSRSGFESGCYKDKKGWSAYMKQERFDTKSYVFIETDDLPQLLTILEQAKPKLT